MCICAPQKESLPSAVGAMGDRRGDGNVHVNSKKVEQIGDILIIPLQEDPRYDNT